MIKDHLGNEFKNIRYMAEHYNIEPASLYTRINQLKWDIKKALLTPINKPKRSNKHVLDGKIFYGDEQLAEYLGVSKSSIYNYLKKGLSPEDILEEISKKRIKAPDGNFYKNLKEISIAYNVPYKQLRYRINDRGLSLEDALSSDYKEKYSKRRTGITDHLNNKFKTVKEAADFYSISEKTIYERMNKGKTKKEIFARNKTKNILYKGVRYRSLYQLCKCLNLPYRAIVWRYHKTNNLMQSIDYYDKKELNNE